ncbi:MAG TPA: rhomboid family intramembrane serine protease [Candidatus Sulfotelmatobacter sp.]
MTLSFPPFTRWVKRLIIICATVYFLQVAVGAFAHPIERDVEIYLGLVPALVLHYGFLWQLATYSFLHASISHLLLNMLTLWMFGSQEEQDWGSRKFVEFYFFCVIGAALVTVAVAYTPVPGASPNIPTIGASGGIYGLLIAFGMLYGDREIYMFPFPFSIKAKYLVGIIIFVVVIATFQPSQGGVANFAHLGGLLFGFLYIKFAPTRGLLFGASERYFNARNSYYRWKRRRAAKKFEVYMRQHDRKVEFDEHGNYIPPPDDNPRKGNGGSKSGWVN